MSSPVSTPRWRRPEVSITSCVRQNLSIASATKPWLHALRARSISASRSAAALRLAQDALVGVGDLRIGEMRAGQRHLAARQIDRRRRRPMLLEQVLHGVDGRADALDQRIAVARIADRGRQHVGDAHRAVVAQQRHPGVEGAGNAGREQPGAGHEIEAELVAIMRDGGAGRDASPARRSPRACRAARRRGSPARRRPAR